MKLFIKLLFLLLITLGAYFGYHIGQKPTTLFPFPYILESTLIKERSQAENADVLIVGDQMAASLKKVEDELIRKSSPGFSQDLKIFNWGEANEGAHRTIRKLKSLKIIPELVIYLGGSHEFYEKKFDLNEKDNFFKNIKKFSEPKTKSALLSYPPLSKFIYHYDEYTVLGDRPIKDLRHLPAAKKLQQLEMGYIIYNQELIELLDLAREKKFKLFFMTSPINLNIPPKETCSNSTSPTLKKEHGILERMIKAGRTKDAFSELKKLGQSFPGNAYNYFLLGLTLKSMGKFQEARAVFEQGTFFDCYSWRANLASHNIIRKISTLSRVPLIDFDEIVNGHFGHKQLFQDEIYPLNELYKLLVEKLAPQINHFFKD